jgi:predicted RNase H-like HicB family nuclease
MNTMNLRIIVEPDEDVYVAYCPELPGCVTYGSTLEEARENIMEALQLYLRPSNEEIPSDAKIFEISV